jgi:hypothetical protein
MECVQASVQVRKKKRPQTIDLRAFELVAEWTGLEPATSGVTGQHSNQLNYHSAFAKLCLSCVTAARSAFLVGAEGFEPPTLSV